MDIERVKERLYNRTVLSDDDSCWLWLGATRGRGYGAMWDGKKTRDTHRISYEVHVGPIPTGMQVLHQCDNPACINPYHLYSGTHQDNMDDKTRRARNARGEGHGISKLTEGQVQEIRARVAQGEKQYVIAPSYGVSKSTISRIITGECWAHTRKEVHKEQ